MTIEALTHETAQEYRHEIARFYYDNMLTCSCLGHYTYDQAYEKIGDLIAHLETHTCICYGAFENDEIIAYIWAYPHPFREETRMYVNELHVREHFRGRGIGTALLNRVEAWAKEAGFPALYLHAEAGNPDAVRFYESTGFIPERIQFRKDIVARL